MGTPIKRIENSIRVRVWKTLKHGLNGKSLERRLGYSPQELRKHLEKMFKDGMSWENYGDWHVDHILPVSSFNYQSENDAEFKECWGLSNLQPLWAHDNFTKGNKILK